MYKCLGTFYISLKLRNIQRNYLQWLPNCLKQCETRIRTAPSNVEFVTALLAMNFVTVVIVR